VSGEILTQPYRLAAIDGSDLVEAETIPALDDLVRDAARLRDAPISQVKVVMADAQIPVSHVGTEEWGRAVTLDRSFCQHAVTAGEPLAIEDARQHPLVRDSPAPVSAGIVAYLSVPVVSPRATSPIATLCVVDFRPRRWTPRELATLADLAKNLKLRIEAGEPRLAALADAAKVRQVVANVLANAVKFTDRGGREEMICSAEGDEMVRIEVRDTGIGLEPDQIGRIFDPFVQVRSDLTRLHEGTGLGFAISRDLARRMGGDLVIVSTPGRGSSFTVTLPRA
jgi:signal transduction histidine kinase